MSVASALGIVASLLSSLFWPGMIMAQSTATDATADHAQKLATVAQYNRLLEQQQSHYGTWDEGLAETYAGLGSSLQSLDQHEQAIEAFSQAIHIQRVNGGLYNLESAPLLEKLIDSHMASSDWQTVDSRFHFLLQLYAQNYDPQDPRLLPVLDKAIRWHLHAFSQGYGKDPLEHILTARDLLYTSTRILESNYGNSDRRLAQQLNAVAVANYYAAIYQAENSQVDTQTFQTGETRNIFSEAAEQERNRENLILSSFTTGRKALEHLVDLNAKNPDTPAENKALALIKLGDWNLLFKRTQQAIPYYQQAFAILQAQDAAHPVLTEQFSKPVMLPQTDDLDLDYPVPETKNKQQSGFIVLGFNVSPAGKATDIEVVETSPDSSARRIVDAKRLLIFSRFRPQISAGYPVATPNMQYRYTYNYKHKKEDGMEKNAGREPLAENEKPLAENEKPSADTNQLSAAKVNDD